MNITLGARPKKATLPDEDTNDQFDALIKDLQDLVTTLKAYQIVVGTDVVGAGDATKYLAGGTIPAWQFVKDSDLSLSNITTNNVSTSKHGFAPIAPNDATKFLDGTGAYSAPATIALFLSSSQLTGNQFAALNTTPFTLVAGQASKLLVPIAFRIVSNKTGGAWTNGNTGFYIAYESNKNTNLTTTIGLGLAGGGTVNAFGYQPISISNTASLTLSGKGLQLVTQLDITSGSGGTTVINVDVLYSIQSPALF